MSGFTPVALALALALPASAQTPSPYSLPWQLRPTAAGSVLRSDTSIAFGGGDATPSFATTASMLMLSHRVHPNLAPMVRLAVVNHAPSSGQGGFALANPAFGVTWAQPLSSQLRLALFLGLTAPIGMGGGDPADPAASAAVRAAILARSAMDNAMFAVNDFTVFPGVGLSYTAAGFTAQVEATVLQLTRVRGTQPDASRTNFTSGVHVGYFVVPQVSLGAELRYQRWLSTPVAVTTTPSLRDTFTWALGARGHFEVGEKRWLRPGISFARGFDPPMASQGYSVLQIDLPFAF